MSMVNTKSTTPTLKIAINLAVLGAVLSQMALPVVVKADIASEVTKMPKLSLNTVFQEQTVKQLPTAPTNLGLRPVDREVPDKVIAKAVITAYTSTPGQTDDTPFIAASGKRVHDGMIAANGLPFGTRVKIPAVYGEKIFVVEDRMNRRYGIGRFDVWLDMSRAEAMKFGVKRVEVEIFYPEKVIAKK
jgi:3D (Asp-Asp-Asp) domain-containing protein